MTPKYFCFVGIACALLLAPVSYGTEPEILYLDCKPEVVKPLLEKIKKSVNGFCGARQVKRIKVVKCREQDGVYEIQVLYMCKE